MPVIANALLAGQILPFARGEDSAIAKSAIAGPVTISFAGIVGDEQADPEHHGGRDKALHHYPFDHYPRWRRLLPASDLLGAPGAFGENISTVGLSEDQVCIGDRFRLGTALLEISQGRKPCWKQGDRLHDPMVPALMVEERLSGWYYRVIEEGEACAGDVMMLEARPLPDWTVKRVFGILIAGDFKQDIAALSQLEAMDLLHDGWRQRAGLLRARMGG
jgi:MOSC domain-containing protein YiiM